MKGLTATKWFSGKGFRLWNDFGKCMKGLVKLPRCKKKLKEDVIQERFQSHFMDAFGDLLSAEQSQTFRCASRNVQMLPESAHHCESRQLVNHIRDSEHDLIMMQEIGLCWNKLRTGHAFAGWHGCVCSQHSRAGPLL
jgi:hypothetical protein